MSARAFTTYVRKIGDGQFEYGWYRDPKNFRKQSAELVPAGILATVGDAETARAALPFQPNYATYYGSKIHPEQVHLGGPDQYGINTYVEPYDPRLAKPECPYCGATEALRVKHDGGRFEASEFTCEACFTGTDTGPSFDDLPLAEV